MLSLLYFLIELIGDPKAISITCTVFIVGYYIVSIPFIQNAKLENPSSIWAKNGFFDIATSVIWILVSALLISSLFELAGNEDQLSIKYLILYYFFFIFLFGILYGLLEWHRPGMLSEIDANSWSGEVGYIIIMSIQTQTTLGYTRAKPSRVLTEIVACVQALLGLFFCLLFIARAI